MPVAGRVMVKEPVTAVAVVTQRPAASYTVTVVPSRGETTVGTRSSGSGSSSAVSVTSGSAGMGAASTFSGFTAGSAGFDGRLYGSFSSRDIADALKEQHGIEIDRRKIVVENPIKAFGSYQFEVKLYPQITGTVNVLVTD